MLLKTGKTGKRGRKGTSLPPETETHSEPAHLRTKSGARAAPPAQLDDQPPLLGVAKLLVLVPEMGAGCAGRRVLPQGGGEGERANGPESHAACAPKPGPRL